VTYYGVGQWQPFASVDLDSDGTGRPALAARRAHRALADGRGVPPRATAYTGYAGAGFKVVAAGDFNGDGASDMALASGNQLKVWINNGHAGFTQGAPVLLWRRLGRRSRPTTSTAMARPT
jgi:hypothetical protein